MGLISKSYKKLNMELDQPQLTREVPLSNNSSPNIILDGFRVKSHTSHPLSQVGELHILQSKNTLK